MSEFLFDEAIDAKLAKMEEIFRQSLEEVLGTALNKPCAVAKEETHTFDFRTIKGLFTDQIVFVSVPMQEGPTGEMKFLLNPADAAFLADVMMMGDGSAEFSQEEHLDAVKELFAQILGGYATTLGAEFDVKLTFGSVQAILLDISPSDFSENNWVWSPYKIDLEGEKLLVKLTSHKLVQNLAEAVAEKDATVEEVTTVVEAKSPRAPSDPSDKEIRDMAMLLDIELPILIELGRTSLLIREILKLGPGSIVELDKLSGEPVDIFVNEKKIAEGEVVVIEENFGVRITELVRPDERLKALSG